ncbi:unnamed protein product [Amoebophrya sp. A25]|nr:unnamed protein product [Amoebophrya sp. A25]|eukprot:GSA25T00019709001.1
MSFRYSKVGALLLEDRDTKFELRHRPKPPAPQRRKTDT